MMIDESGHRSGFGVVTDAEPVAYMHPNGAIWRLNNCPEGIDWQKDGWTPLYTAPPSPSVAVKALDWREDWGGSDDDIVAWVADTPWGRVFASMAGYRDANGKSYERHADVPDELRVELQSAKEADYEARILSALSALSAQMQDVAGQPAEKHARVNDDMVAWAREAYRKKTGAEEYQLDGWIDDALRASLEAALTTEEVMSAEPSETEKLRSALAGAVHTIQDYLAYKYDGDPWTEDSRAMGEMDINDYGDDGRLSYALGLLSEPNRATLPAAPAAKLEEKP